MPTLRLADAVILPSDPGGRSAARVGHERFNRAFGPTCGCWAFWWRLQGAQSYGVPRRGPAFASYVRDLADSTLFFPQDHPLAGRPRYRWFYATIDFGTGLWKPAAPAAAYDESPGLVKLGFRVPDPAAGDPAVARAQAEGRERRAEQYRGFLEIALNTPDLYRKIRGKLGYDDVQMEVAFAHVGRVPFY